MAFLGLGQNDLKVHTGLDAYEKLRKLRKGINFQNDRVRTSVNWLFPQELKY